MMTDKAKAIARALQDYASQYQKGDPSVYTPPVEYVAEMIERLSNRCGELASERDEWKLRCEAAEGDIRRMLAGSGACCYCGNFATDKCSWENCPDVAVWRGPCAENGGEIE